MSWISPTFSGDIGPSTPAPKRKKTTDTVEPEASSTVTVTPTSTSDWLQKYCPKSVDELAINIKKLNELEAWLKQTYAANSSSKFLLITGPPGCGKTTALQVLCRKLGFRIQEWITPMDKQIDDSEFPQRYEFSRSTTKQFEDYLFRSSRYGSCLSSGVTKSVVLVKDFPNVFIHNSLTFHECLEKFSGKCVNPVVFICSDESLNRKLFPPTLRYNCNIQSITFNPIPNQQIIKVLKTLLQKETKHNKNLRMLPDDSFIVISSACQGDLRSAIVKLHFCSINSEFDIAQLKLHKGLKKAKFAKEAIESDKDKKIDFFQGIGRILYPKRIESGKELKFVHSTSEIVETFLCEPYSFLNQLHENYPSKFGSVSDLSSAAERLSKSDILMSRWQEKDIFRTYSLSVATQGLMVSNNNPGKSKFEAFRKSHTSRLEVDSKALEVEGKSIFSGLCILDYGCLLDILPFSLDLLPNLNHGQTEFVRKVCKFK